MWKIGPAESPTLTFYPTLDIGRELDLSPFLSLSLSPGPPLTKSLFFFFREMSISEPASCTLSAPKSRPDVNFFSPPLTP